MAMPKGIAMPSLAVSASVSSFITINKIKLSIKYRKHSKIAAACAFP
jgi:hypothetical protein